jgi:hypothetical protein
VVLVALAGCSAEEATQTPCGAGVICAGDVDTGVRLDAAADRGAADRPSSNDLGLVRDAIAIREVTRIVVDPPTATLTVRDGAPATQAFAVVGTFNDGTSRPLANGTWSMPASLVAAADVNTGTVTAGGRAGGLVELTVRVPGPGGAELTATAAVTVRVERAVLVNRLVPDVIAQFAAAPTDDAARRVTVRYPLDRAMIPTNLPAPDVQWEGGAAGDFYRVRIAKPHAQVDAYLQHGGAAFGYDWSVDPEAWRALLESDPADPLTFTVDRWDAAMRQRIAGEAVTVRVARAVLSGTIYYWDLSNGRLMRLNAITGERSLTVANPPAQPSGEGAGSRCIACHTVSRDGRYLSAELWGGDQPGVAIDLTSSELSRDPAPTVFGPRDDLRYLFSTFSPDSNYLVINRGNEMRLLERATGNVIPDSGLPADHIAHPDWSPDGMSVAMVANTNGTWAVDFTRGDIAVVPRTGTTTFGPPRVVHRGTTEAEPAVGSLVTDAHPTFSPDNAWIAFQHGTNSRGGNEATHYPGRLELVGANATPDAPSLVLANANGSGEPDSYWPNFSPFDQGGHFWVAFYSRRDYGNAQVGTRGTRRRQIWVAAISNRPTAGADPSEVPYWLPGQATAQENMSAYWAPVACRMNAERCSVSSECCSGLCDRGADGMFVCTPPPPAMCRREGTTCSTTTDCCDGLMCFNRVCGRNPG